MGNPEQVGCFQEEVSKLINYFASEFDLSYAEMVGVLEIEKFMLIERINEDEDDDEEEDCIGET